MDAGRELDALVAEKIIKLSAKYWRPTCFVNDHELDANVWCYDCSGMVDDQERVPEHYSTEIAAAWLVVEKLATQGLRLSLDAFGGDPWWVEFADEQWERGAQATANTAPHAICLAALKAVGA